MNITMSGSPFLVFDLSWPVGYLPTLPVMVVVYMADYVMDGDDDDEIDAEFFDRIEKQTGVRPTGFSFAPCDDIADFDDEDAFWDYAHELAEDYA